MKLNKRFNHGYCDYAIEFKIPMRLWWFILKLSWLMRRQKVPKGLLSPGWGVERD